MLVFRLCAARHGFGIRGVEKEQSVIMKYLSLFSGIGGFELGIQNAYTNRRKHMEGPVRPCLCSDGRVPHTIYDCWRNGDEFPTCVGFSEIDKYAIQIYNHHFLHENIGDITKVQENDLADFDLLVGGFPCQSFSIAGKRRGFEDTRGTLFFDIARILAAKKPRLLLLENVKGLLSHEEGRTFSTIIATLDELGYDLQWQVLNSKNFGVPQNRERIFIVGHLRGTSRPQVFPLSGNNEEAIFGTVKNTYHKGQTTGSYINEETEIGTLRTHKDGNGFRKIKSGLCPTIPARAREDGSGQPIIRVREATRKGYAEAGLGDSINLSVPNSKTRRGRIGKGVAQTLDTGMQQHTLVPQGGSGD
jgi:DNA (cytosine-5)-methyltransferase 1